jgi:hypothetical protein
MRLFYRVAVLFAAGTMAWAAKTEVLFFVSTDCPVSNSFAPEIQHICRDYAARGVGCSLVYEDVQLDALTMRKHLHEYGYEHISAIIDADRRIANHAHATITPQAVVIDSADKIRYRGRINNFYAALGKPRQVVTVHDVRDALDAVLAGKTVSHPETTALGCYIVPPDILKEQK